MLICVGCISLLAGLLFGYLVLTAAAADKLPPLQNGDLVFQTSDSEQSRAILLATGSLYSHMGMIKIGKDGAPYVVEAVGPVREVPLSVWVKSGVAGRLTIKRYKGLDSKQQATLLKAAKYFYGRAYDPYFSFDNETIYCSELIYYVYKNIGVDIGEIQTMQDLNMANSAVRQLIMQRWNDHPLCSEGKTPTIGLCLQKVMRAPLITPISIAKDPRLETIYTNYLASKG